MNKPHSVVIRHPDGSTTITHHVSRGGALNAAQKARIAHECPVYVYPADKLPKDPQAMRYRVVICYPSPEPSDGVVTFETSELGIANEAYRLTKIPEKGAVKIQSQSTLGGDWTTLVSKL